CSGQFSPRTLSTASQRQPSVSRGNNRLMSILSAGQSLKSLRGKRKREHNDALERLTARVRPLILVTVGVPLPTHSRQSYRGLTRSGSPNENRMVQSPQEETTMLRMPKWILIVLA